MEKKKIVIIGGGVAGLSTGIYSQLNGFESEIVEMHNQPGGQCTAWDRKGYRFDYCLHWLVGSAHGTFHDIWTTTDVIKDSVEIVNHEIFARVKDEDGSDFIVYSDIDRWQKYLVEMAPEDSKAIAKMCRQMKKGALLDNFVTAPGLRKPFEYIRTGIKMMPLVPLMARFAKMTSSEYIKWLGFKNEKLNYFMGKLYGEANFSALAIILMLGWFHDKNAGYLIGGSLPFSLRMARKYESLGGKFRYRKRVEKIIVENSRAVGVLLEDGSEIRSDWVVSAADGHSTIFSMLEGKYISEKISDAYNNWELFTPLVQVSFGINDIVESEFDTTTYLSNREIGRTKLRQGFSIMNQSAFDPTMAPEGKSTLIMRFESPWEIWEKLEGEEYKAEKEIIRTTAISILEKQWPGITKKIEVIDVATPKTGVRYTGVWKGAYEGFMPTGDVTKSLDMKLPGLDRFYMAGQWLFPGGGLPPSAQSGSWVIQKICRETKQKFVSG